MTGSWKRAIVAGALCLGLVDVTASAAQDHPQGPAQGPGAAYAPGRHGGPDHEKRLADMREHREKRLHDLLQIKPDQDAAFHAYIAAITPPPRDGKPGGWGHHGEGAMPMTTPERLDRMAARMAERQARFQQMAAATKTFYAALTPDQRRAFDAMPMMEHGGHHEGMRGEHPWEGPR